VGRSPHLTRGNGESGRLKRGGRAPKILLLRGSLALAGLGNFQDS
jgi:hypothetical protein